MDRRARIALSLMLVACRSTEQTAQREPPNSSTPTPTASEEPASVTTAVPRRRAPESKSRRPTLLSEGKLHIVAHKVDDWPYRVHPFGRQMVVTHKKTFFTYATAISAEGSLAKRFAHQPGVNYPESQQYDHGGNHLEETEHDFETIEGDWPDALRLYGTDDLDQRMEGGIEYRYQAKHLETTGQTEDARGGWIQRDWQAPAGNQAFMGARGAKALVLKGSLNRELKRSTSLCSPAELNIRAVASNSQGALFAVTSGCGSHFLESWGPNAVNGTALELPGSPGEMFHIAEGGGAVFVVASDSPSTRKAPGPIYIAIQEGSSVTELETHDAAQVAALTVAEDGTAFVVLPTALVSVTRSGHYRRYPAPPHVELASAWARNRDVAFVGMASSVQGSSAIFATTDTPLLPGPLPKELIPFEPYSPDCTTPFVFFENIASAASADEAFRYLTADLSPSPYKPSDKAPKPSSERLVLFPHSGVKRLGLVVPTAAVGKAWISAYRRDRRTPEPLLVCFQPPDSATTMPLSF